MNRNPPTSPNCSPHSIEALSQMADTADVSVRVAQTKMLSSAVYAELPTASVTVADIETVVGAVNAQIDRALVLMLADDHPAIVVTIAQADGSTLGLWWDCDDGVLRACLGSAGVVEAQIEAWRLMDNDFDVC